MLPSIVNALIDSAHTESSLEIYYLLNTKLIFQDRSLEVLSIITNEEKGIIFHVVTENHEKKIKNSHTRHSCFVIEKLYSYFNND